MKEGNNLSGNILNSNNFNNGAGKDAVERHELTMAPHYQLSLLLTQATQNTLGSFPSKCPPASRSSLHEHCLY